MPYTPSSSRPKRSSPPSMTFDEIFFRVNENNNSDDCKSGLCPSTSEVQPDWITQSLTQCESEDEAYCWMNCLPLNSTCPAEGQVCIGTEGRQCEDEDMDFECHWECMPEEPPEVSDGTRVSDHRILVQFRAIIIICFAIAFCPTVVHAENSTVSD